MNEKNNNTRLNIGLFGRRNTGKSSVINALTGQNLSIVSDIAGTTTDPVRKSVEIPGLGPVILVDTAGIDDHGELGQKRTEKTRQTIRQVDMAVIVLSDNIFSEDEKMLAQQLEQLQIPFIIMHNKSDEISMEKSLQNLLQDIYAVDILDFSAKTGVGMEKLINLLQKNIPDKFNELPPLFADKITSGDMVLMITPIDTEAPAGRMILPQVQAIREALDNNCVVTVLKEPELRDFMERTCIMPNLVITDSQLFGKIDKIIPPEIALTSFSILLARQKGNFEAFLKGTSYIDKLKDGDRILVMESCTHHSTCDDIGRVKIPHWLEEYTGRHFEFDILAGLTEPQRPITDYALVLQCGGCMITHNQLLNRIQIAIDANVPVTNYGMAIAYIKGSWKRSVQLFL
ncbi:MAG: [FeFe] hydrogenase H-cluster maturation GTPase HydF [Paludibacter sp.]|nr:[FeFe] hydrogenase H-cluster maturation GTPase HydF [Paludibacter sp.]